MIDYKTYYKLGFEYESTRDSISGKPGRIKVTDVFDDEIDIVVQYVIVSGRDLHVQRTWNAKSLLYDYKYKLAQKQPDDKFNMWYKLLSES